MRELLNEANKILTGLVGLQPNKSNLCNHVKNSWEYPETVSGVYEPNTFTAHIRLDHPYPVLTLFHEYHGHGLLAEHTPIGGKTDVTPQQRGLIEGIATTIEAYLATQTGRENLFLDKLGRMSLPYQAAYDYCSSHAADKTLHHLLYLVGLPKHYNTGQAKELLLKNTPIPAHKIKMAFLYGSQKPLSDIDYFVVADTPSTQVLDDVLDITIMNTAEFQHRLNHLDIAVTDPLMSGELLIGDKHYLGALRHTLTHTPITPIMIRYAEASAFDQREKADNPAYDRDTALSFAESYEQAATQMRRGRRKLTMKGDIISFPLKN